MGSRNQKVRSLAHKIAQSKQIALAVEMSGWETAWLWINIIASVDHFGRMEGSEYQVREMIFGMYPSVLPSDVLNYLQALESVGLIIRYKVNGLAYIQLPKIGKYQKIVGNMAEESDFPSPPDSEVEAWSVRFKDEYCPMIIKKVKAKVDPVDDVEAVIHYWNDKVRLSKVNHINKDRTDKIRLRFQDKGFKENWKKAIDKVSQSSFCCGTNKTGWRATLDWFIKNDMNWVKAVEGKYDDRRILSAVDEWIRGGRKDFN